MVRGMSLEQAESVRRFLDNVVKLSCSVDIVGDSPGERYHVDLVRTGGSRLAIFDAINSEDTSLWE